ncbi:MAG TPA: hypothetical protein VFC46_09115 [Humisphaera sp.]|nr:hypothetical protein [Humisphaera sp.]
MEFVANFLDWPEEDMWFKGKESIDRLFSLEDDWDGMGAKAPSAILIGNANDFLQSLRCGEVVPPPSAVVATPLGTIMFEWQGMGAYFEAVISRPYVAEFLFEGLDGESISWEVPWKRPSESSSWAGGDTWEIKNQTSNATSVFSSV